MEKNVAITIVLGMGSSIPAPFLPSLPGTSSITLSPEPCISHANLMIQLHIAFVFHVVS